MAEKYHLSYFDLRGRAEPIRMILSYGKANWSEERLPSKPEPREIPEHIKKISRFGQVPLLQWDDKTLASTQAICRYFARKYGLTGVDDWEAAKCDEMVDGVFDFQLLFKGAYSQLDLKVKAEIIETAKAKGLIKYIHNFNDALEKNGGHLVGKQLTWADIVVANAIDFAERIYGIELTVQYPRIRKFMDMVFDTPGIREWIARRPAIIV